MLPPWAASPGRREVTGDLAHSARGPGRLEIKAAQRSSSSLADLCAQHSFLIGVRDTLTETHQAVLDIAGNRLEAVRWPATASRLQVLLQLLDRRQ